MQRTAIVAEVDLLRIGARVDDIRLVGLRIAEVQHRHAGRGEQGLIGIEPDLPGVTPRRIARQRTRAILADEDIVDRCQRRQIGAEQHRALRNGRKPRGGGAEDIIVTLALQCAIPLGIVEGEHRAAAIVGKRRTHRRGEAIAVAIAIIADARLPGDLQSVEAALQSEVYHTRGRIRTIGRRRAAGDHLDILDQRFGNDVEIDRAVGVGRLDAPPVEQQQRPLRSQTAQRGIGLPAIQPGRGAAGIARAERSGELRQLRQRAFHRHAPGILDCCAAHRHDRRVGDIVRPRDAAAGNDDVLGRRRRRGGVLRLGNRLGRGRWRVFFGRHGNLSGGLGGDQRDAGSADGQQRAKHETLVHGVSIPLKGRLVSGGSRVKTRTLMSPSPH